MAKTTKSRPDMSGCCTAVGILSESQGLFTLESVFAFYAFGTQPEGLTDEEQAVFDFFAAYKETHDERDRKRVRAAKIAANARWHPDRSAAPPDTPPADSAAKPVPRSVSPAPTHDTAPAASGSLPDAPKDSPAEKLPQLSTSAEAGASSQVVSCTVILPPSCPPTRDDCEKLAISCGRPKEYGEMFYYYNARKGWTYKKHGKAEKIYNLPALFDGFAKHLDEHPGARSVTRPPDEAAKASSSFPPPMGAGRRRSLIKKSPAPPETRPPHPEFSYSTNRYTH